MNKLSFYLRSQKWVILLVTITGILYNIGMVAGPYFEGRMVQYLFDILSGLRTSKELVYLAVLYVAVIAFVQFNRFLKRFFVRRFANNLSRSLKETVFHNMLARSSTSSDVGNSMTAAIYDVETCVEGIRKAFTEIFDTGIVMIAYIVMLVRYDWKLTLVCALFPPIAAYVANRLKKTVTSAQSQARRSFADITAASMDLSGNAVTYRVYGMDSVNQERYEQNLTMYHKKAVRAGIFQNSAQPLYLTIANIGFIPIIYFGAHYVNTGIWTIAVFSTYVSCFNKFAKKSSNVAKLFNAIQKARVSWDKVQPYLVQEEKSTYNSLDVHSIRYDHVSFGYSNTNLLNDISFRVSKGEILGITGAVACGKSTLARLLLNEDTYSGFIYINDTELKNTDARFLSYVGHQPEIFNASIRDNICLGDESGDLEAVLKDVALADEVRSFEQGIDTMLGTDGTRLSGGQQARIALARAMYHKSSVLILDDPFSALDVSTEAYIMEQLKKYDDRIILLISHRLGHFDETDKVLLIENGNAVVSTHEQLLQTNDTYKTLYALQGGKHA